MALSSLCRFAIHLFVAGDLPGKFEDLAQQVVHIDPQRTAWMSVVSLHAVRRRNW
jgi:hypothetical protein